jgi:hypothetical protein
MIPLPHAAILVQLVPEPIGNEMTIMDWGMVVEKYPLIHGKYFYKRKCNGVER